MRYITHHANLVLYKNDGTVAERFGPNGVLIVGSASTSTGSGNSIDTTDLMKVYSTDLDGNTVTTIEMNGLGSLNGTSATGGTVDPKEKGYRLFFEAPVLSGGATLTTAMPERYKVLTGSITYNGVTYKKNEVFKSSSGVTATAGSGTFAAYIPESLAGEPPIDRDGLFDDKHLLYGDETYTSFSFNNPNGVDPYNSLTSSDENYIGWKR